MTDTSAGRTDWTASDQTIPLVPDSGYTQPDLPPLPEETVVEPAGAGDPWASGPGLGTAAAPESTLTLSSDPASAAPTAPIPVRAATPAPAATGWPNPAPAPQAPTAVAFGYGSPADYPRTSGYAAPAAEPGGTSPLPAYGETAVRPPVAAAPPSAPPSNAYPRPPYASYPEPDGPAASIVNQPYAASGYAGQHWSGGALVDPISYDYGYGGRPTAPHPNAVTSMVLGILGLVVFTPLAPVAWYMAARGRREMRYDPRRWAPSPMLTAGMVMGIIGTALMVLVGFFLLLLIGFAAANS